MVKNLLVKMIRCYQKCLSPMKTPCCRFIPTCSQYAAEAIETHGALKGGLLSIYRVLRCNPLCRGGYDPVPPKKKKKVPKK